MVLEILEIQMLSPELGDKFVTGQDNGNKKMGQTYWTVLAVRDTKAQQSGSPFESFVESLTFKCTLLSEVINSLTAKKSI